MKLLTKELEKKIPAFYSTEEIKTDEKIVQAKFFTPRSNWTWYVVEYDPEEKLFFGLVDGFEKEWGYFSLEELQELADKGTIERDIYFEPYKVKDIK